VQGNRTTVRFNNSVADREAHPRSFRARLGRKKGLEDLIHDIGGDTLARIDDLDEYGGPVLVWANPNGKFVPLSGHGLFGILQQVLKDLIKL
jgi:hypothetical protein